MADEDEPLSAEEAYARAEEIIAQAKRSGAKTLNLTGLSGTSYVSTFGPAKRVEGAGLASLTRLPDSINELTEVTEIWLPSTQISDLRPLSFLTGIQSLGLCNTQVSDISALAGMTGMHGLDLRNTQVNNISALVGMEGIQNLDLNGTQIDDISVLAGMRGMENLGLTGTQVSDIAALAGLSGMQVLGLFSTQVSDLRPIKAMDRLVYLSFGNTPATRNDPKLAEFASIEDETERVKRTLVYLKGLPPLPTKRPDGADYVPPQNNRALTYGVKAGQVVGANDPDPSSLSDSARSLHPALKARTEAMIANLAPVSNAHIGTCETLNAYAEALGETPEDMVPTILFVAGLDLREALRLDEDLSGGVDDLAGDQPLGPTRQSKLRTLVQMHNTFSANHTELAKYDTDQIDPVDRFFGERDKAAMHEMVKIISARIAEVEESVRRRLETLDREAAKTGKASERALTLESESLNNFVTLVVTETVKQIDLYDRSPTKGSGIGGDVRAGIIAAVSAAAVTNASIDPDLAQFIPDLVLALEPYMGQLFASLPGNTEPLEKVVAWIVARLNE
ncbi:MAG: hypothetical protein AAGF71_09800 [Pseudomonadota bacterium]